jgi:hypothetical protein
MQMDTEADVDEAGGGEGGRRVAKAYGTNVTLRDLVDEGLLAPGEGVLSVTYKNESWAGDLTKEGLIKADGQEFSKLTTFAVAMIQKTFPGLKTKNGWEAVSYQGR